MSDTTATTGAAHDSGDDERLAYRGVFQRVFVRPEIGAIIGAIGIWVFFWAVSVTLGTANGASNILDSSTNIGIMAVAVAMLMIGGEFDLSSGANTGAMGMLVILLVKETGELGGAGLSLWIAIPLSFLVAMGIGWLNGYMVERTLLPSFIITLATFFVLKGLKLGITKRLIDQIQAGRTDEGHGYDFWQPIFAGEWVRNEHQFEARDWVYSICVLAGLALLTLAVYELNFKAKEIRDAAGAAQFGVGVVVAVVGVILLHVTDGVGGNILGAVVTSVGGLAALVGLGRWRYQSLGDRGSVAIDGDVRRFMLLGVGAIVLSVLSALVFDPDDATDIFFPFTEQGLRATLFVGLAVGAFTLLFIASSRAKRVSAGTKLAVTSFNALVLVGLAFFVRSESGSPKFRTEAFSVLIAGAVLLLAWAVVGALFEERRATDAAAEKLSTRLVIMGGILLTIGFAVKLLFTTDAEIEAGLATAKFSMRILWFLAFTAVMAWVLARTRFGSWTFAVGGNKEASRQVGVPAARTKTRLFMLVSGAAWLVGMLIAFRINSIQANQGDGEEFEFIIAAVVGGTLLTGGYGTVVGAGIGAVIMSMATLGIPNSRWNSDWRFLFLGVILLLAVIANRSIRTKAEALR